MALPSRTVQRRERWIWSAVAGLVVCTPLAGAAAPQASEPPTGSSAFVQKHCATCHNDKNRTAGLSLQAVDLTAVAAHAEIWEKVLRKVRSGEMPPPNIRLRPAAAEADALATYLETTLDRAAATTLNPGRPGVHRLNRAEYSNAIRDLLSVDIKPGSWLPVDDSGYGFDNIGAVLSTSPALIERYISAARRVSRLAVGDLSQRPYEEIYDAPRDPFKGVRNERLTDELPFDSRAGLSVRHYFPADAEYVFKVRFRGLPPPVTIGEPDLYEFRIPVTAGLHVVGVTSPRENAKIESEGAGGRAGAGLPSLPYPVDLRLDGARIKRFDVAGGVPEISRLIVGGPYNPTGRGQTASRAKIFVCRPARERDEPACARTILKTLARRAFRRPVTSADIDPLYAMYERGRLPASALAKAGDFDHGVQNALQAILVSPEFLFRIEQDPPGFERGKAYRLTDLELASRLSFFLWSSIPDDQLLDLAERGKLKDSIALEKQVRRMLADPRADAMVANFAGQWLQLRNVGTVQPDPVIFSFDEALRQSFVMETELLFATILREDRSILDLLRADYTFVNERLAEHYGIPKVYGSQFRQIAVTDPNRRGLLGHGSVLTLTSYPNRTSVVQRGKWILENLLGTPPPPPPPDVPELQAKKDGMALSLRQQMEAHRSNAVCAACHARMDPIGFALENYDAIGKWRSEDAGIAIDASGTLPDGTAFQGAAGLTQLLLTKYKDDFVRTATEKLLTYALGRGVEYYDNPATRAIAREAAREDYRFSALVLAVVKSKPFQMRRASES
jgi:mono/diheme cytochrome c family protein